MAVLPGCVHLCITLMKVLNVLDLKAVLVEQKKTRLWSSPESRSAGHLPIRSEAMHLGEAGPDSKGSVGGMRLRPWG